MISKLTRSIFELIIVVVVTLATNAILGSAIAFVMKFGGQK